MRTTTHTGSATARLFALVVALLAGAASLFGGGVQEAQAAGCTYGLSSNTYSAQEGNAIVVTVNRTGSCPANSVSAAISDAGGSADQGIDFENTSLVTFSFPDGDATPNSQEVSVSTFEDGSGEPTETFFINLSTPPNGDTLSGISSATLSIIDDDGLPTYSFGSATYTFAENAGTVNVEVLRGGATSGTDIVHCLVGLGGVTPAQANDITGTSADQTITFTPGQTSRNCQIIIVDDGATESTETLALSFGAVDAGFGGGAGSPATATVSVTDNDGTGTVQFTSSSFPGAEGATAGLTVSRSGGSSGAISATCSTVGGTATPGVDYTPVTNQLLNWSGGDSSNETCSISILNDFVADNGETILVQLSSANIGAPSIATVTIDDLNTPTITSIVPASCLVAGGSTVTINGTGFVNGGTTVLFGTQNGAVQSVGGSTSLTVICPAQAGTGVVDVRVTTSAGMSPNTTADDFTYGNLTVTITSVTPAAGSIFGQNQVVIAGSNFTNVQSVSFGAFPALSYTVNGPTSITAVAPPQSAGTVDIVVTTLTGINTTVGAQNDYTYTAGPTVTNLNPSTGPASGTTIVTITGTNFSNSGLVVRFGGVIATSNFINATTIIAVAPAQSAGLVDVIVTTAGGVSPNTLADDYTYTGSGVPVITSISPTSGPAGTVVTLTGSGFTGTTAVTFGGTNASFNVTNNTTLTATVPAGAPGGTIDIRVTNGSGTSLNTTADDFNNTSNVLTVTYTLYFRWTLIAWSGIDNISVTAALSGNESPDNPATNNILGQVTVIWWWDAAAQVYRGNFPGSSAPGANDFTTLRRGNSYWFAIAGPNTQQWTVVQGP